MLVGVSISLQIVKVLIFSFLKTPSRAVIGFVVDNVSDSVSSAFFGLSVEVCFHKPNYEGSPWSPGMGISITRPSLKDRK